MNFNIFHSSNASIIESRYLDLNLSKDLSKCLYVVNLSYNYLRNKVIIITSPNVKNLDYLSKYNTIISRVPLSIENYQLNPYDPSVDIGYRCNLIPDNRILSPELLNSNESVIQVTKKYIVAPLFYVCISSLSDGHLTSSGFIQQQQITQLIKCSY